MNEQRAPYGIEWTRIKNPDGTVRRGFTWNVLTGCIHDCEWVMPDGTLAVCYAMDVFNKFKMGPTFKDSYYHPNRLSEPKKMKEGAGIFPDSMSDLMAANVDEKHFYAIADVMRETPQHIYQPLTKNASAYLRRELPKNAWLGVSSPPNHMFGNTLTEEQRDRYMIRALTILRQKKEEGYTTWMSLEPLTGNWTILFENLDALSWVVIGAASSGKTYYAPDEHLVRGTVEVMDELNVPIFFKGNMKASPWAAANWREEFPTWRAGS